MVTRKSARDLRTDEQGRNVFSYVDGDVPPDLAWHDDATLREAATLIRRFHDAAAAWSETAGAETICHNAKCNNTALSEV